MMKEILIIGAGGHAKVVLEAIIEGGWARAVGFVAPLGSQSRLYDLPVYSGASEMEVIKNIGIQNIVVALGDNTKRLQIARALSKSGCEFPAIIHPRAYISRSASISRGAVILQNASVGTHAKIGSFVIINSGAIVEHDNEIRSGAHVAPGCALAGQVYVGEKALIGVGSSIKPGVRIGRKVIVGAGTAVVRNIPNSQIVVGAAAREINKKS